MLRGNQKGSVNQGPNQGMEGSAKHDEKQEWALDVYRGQTSGTTRVEEEEQVLEFDLEEEEAVTECVAIAVYYSCKSYNSQILMDDMLMAWNIKKLAKVEKIGDYSFRIEFLTPEEKAKAIDGGPWRHKGDAVIVIHYDGLVRPSKIRIEAIDLWVRFYDLPPAMKKENVARMLGEQVGSFIRMDTRYPRYLRVRVAYPIEKPLEPKIKVRVKGRGLMEILLRYKNVPHFCFSCGRIGHAVANCESGEGNGHEIRFGKELMASPPRRVREITMKSVTSRVMRPLFQVGSLGHQRQSSGGNPIGGHGVHDLAPGHVASHRREHV
ncbi:MAG: DUF4283 domain-containing protein [Maritimibacter sp.]